MAQRNIDFGTFPDDPSADAIRTAFEKVQQNFTELYSSVDAQAVLSINRTPGAGITVNSPTGNVVVSANLANITLSSNTLAVGGNRANSSGSQTISSSVQQLAVDLPRDISDVDNITLDETLTSNIVNANVINTSLTFNGNVGNFTGSLSSNTLSVSGNATAGNISATGASFTTIAGSLTTAAQPNITSVGNLTSLTVTGNLSAGNVDGGNLVSANFFTGDGGLLSNIISTEANFANFAGNAFSVDGANVVGTVANATFADDAENANTANSATQADTANSATIANTVVDNAQPNITSVGTLTLLDITGNLSAGNISSTGILDIIGDANVGNISAEFGSFTNVSGNGSSLTSLNASNLDTGTVPSARLSGSYSIDVDNAANANVANIAGTVTTSAQPNITSVGTLFDLSVFGNIEAGGDIIANSGVFSGDGAELSNIPGANVTGIVANASYADNAGNASSATVANAALIANTVLDNAQPNITSVGTLTGLGVDGDLVAGNITSNVGIISGDGGGLSNIVGANVTGTVANATFADNAGNANVANTAFSVDGSNVTGNVTNALQSIIANTVTNPVQSNITSVGTLTSLDVTGNVSAGNIDAGNLLSANFVTGTLTTNAQPNITSVGTLTELDVAGNLSAGDIIASNVDGGNLVIANFFSGDGSLLTNISVAAGSFIENGNSNVVVDANSNVRVSINGEPNVAVFTENGIGVGGFVSANSLSAINGVSAFTISGNLVTPNQPNITSVGNLTSLTVAGVSNLGPNSNVIITGGVANAFLITDGSGNLSWNTATLVPAQGANTQVIFNDGGSNYAGDAGLTYNKTTDTLTVSNSVVSGNVYANSGTVRGNLLTGTLTTSAQPNITSVGALSSLNVVSNIVAANVTANTGLFTGDGGGLSNIAGANVVGTVSSATSATTAGAVTTNAQPNITSVGTLSSLIVSGNINAGNISGGNRVSANFFAGTLTTSAQPNITSTGTLTGLSVNGNIIAANITANTGVITGNGSGLSSLTGANVTGTVANATFATSAGSATTAGTVTTNAQPNITSVGTLSSLIVNGNVNTANITATGRITANVFQGNASNLTNIPGANVTGEVSFAATANSVAGANVSGAVSFATTANAVAGANVSGTVANATFATTSGTAGTVTTSAQPNITSVGTLTSLSVSGNVSANNVTASSYHIRSVGTGISAAGTTQGTATGLTKEINVVSTVSGTAGVRLPTAVAGMVITITNTTANALRVYPASGGAINTLSANAAFVQGPGATLQFIAPTSTQWYTTGATYA